MNDPEWPRASSLLRRPAAEEFCDIGVVGAPVRFGAITPGRCDLAPGSIRTALAKLSTYDIAADVDLRALTLFDFGDVEAATLAPAGALNPIQRAVSEFASRCRSALVILGGDNSITRGAFRGILQHHPDCGLITLDAHLDVRETRTGLNNGNPIRALIEDGVRGERIAQIGIQPFANSASYAGYARGSGIAVWTMSDVWKQGAGKLVEGELERLGSICDRIYVDLDIDVLDRAFCPSAAGSRPGGMLPRELFEAVSVLGRHPKVRAMDIVEHDPERDTNDLTALAAAECVVRFAAAAAQRKDSLVPAERLRGVTGER